MFVWGVVEVLVNGGVIRVYVYYDLIECGGKICEKVVEEDGGVGVEFVIFLNRLVE